MLLKKRVRFCEISYNLHVRQGILWSVGDGFKYGLEKYIPGISYYLCLIFENWGSLLSLASYFRSPSAESHSSWMTDILLYNTAKKLFNKSYYILKYWIKKKYEVDKERCYSKSVEIKILDDHLWFS